MDSECVPGALQVTQGTILTHPCTDIHSPTKIQQRNQKRQEMAVRKKQGRKC
ncbi:hypothetical protein Nmel_013375 [Mimus melanotis]